jgi:hypothetical protein
VFTSAPVSFDAGTYSFIGGGFQNRASGDNSAIAGGICNYAGSLSFVGGGNCNCATGTLSIVAGGIFNTASGNYSTIGGGYCNQASCPNSTISGGINNIANGCYSTIGGGSTNTASGTYYPTIGGGYNHLALGNYSFVGGGCQHEACGEYMTIAGGQFQRSSGAHGFIGGGQNHHLHSHYGTIGGGCQNTICDGGTECEFLSRFNFIGGGENNLIQRSCYSGILGGCNNTISCYTCSVFVLGSNLYGGASNTTYVDGFSKVSGCFRIHHPDPEKTCSKYLLHSFVESPTEGDNIYRYEIETLNCSASLDLPDYFRFLNKNEQVWVSPKNHFGSAYGVVDKEQTCVSFCSNYDGLYNVLIIGTRKDKGVCKWKGVEEEKGELDKKRKIK